MSSKAKKGSKVDSLANLTAATAEAFRGEASTSIKRNIGTLVAEGEQLEAEQVELKARMGSVTKRLAEVNATVKGLQTVLAKR